MSAAVQAGRAYLSESLGADMSALDAETVISYIAQTYTGGWAAYSALFTDQPAAPAKPVELTIHQLRAKVEKLTGFRFRLHLMDTVDQVTISDDTIMVALSIYKAEDRARRVVVKARGTKIMSWKLVDNDWLMQTPAVMWHDDSATEQIKWGTVNTPERMNDKLDQASLCWRPGSAKSPLDGDIVRYKADTEGLNTFGLEFSNR